MVLSFCSLGKSFGRLSPNEVGMGHKPLFLGIEVDPRTKRVIVLSAIDNLIKGQAGQGVQCLNIMLGLEETIGLPQRAFYP